MDMKTMYPEGKKHYDDYTFSDQENCVETCVEEPEPVLFDYENLHVDQYSGYAADSCDFLFGKEGGRYVSKPCITLSPSGKASRLYIYYYDFMLFDWSISIFSKSKFDEYEDYEFTHKQWM